MNITSIRNTVNESYQSRMKWPIMTVLHQRRVQIGDSLTSAPNPFRGFRAVMRPAISHCTDAGDC